MWSACKEWLKDISARPRITISFVHDEPVSVAKTVLGKTISFPLNIIGGIFILRWNIHFGRSENAEACSESRIYASEVMTVRCLRRLKVNQECWHGHFRSQFKWFVLGALVCKSKFIAIEVAPGSSSLFVHLHFVFDSLSAQSVGHKVRT